jgi:hypothetical protein
MDDVLDGNSNAGPDMEDHEEPDRRPDVEAPETWIRDEDTGRRSDPTVQRQALVVIRVDYSVSKLVIGNWVTGWLATGAMDSIRNDKQTWHCTVRA